MGMSTPNDHSPECGCTECHEEWLRNIPYFDAPPDTLREPPGYEPFEYDEHPEHDLGGEG